MVFNISYSNYGEGKPAYEQILLKLASAYILKQQLAERAYAYNNQSRCLAFLHVWSAVGQTDCEQVWYFRLAFEPWVLLQPLKPSLKPRNILLRPETCSRRGRLCRNAAVSDSCRTICCPLGSASLTVLQQACRSESTSCMQILCRAEKRLPGPGLNNVSSAFLHLEREMVSRPRLCRACRFPASTPDSLRDFKAVSRAMSARLPATGVSNMWSQVSFCK